jgi:hypothetical protein
MKHWSSGLWQLRVSWADTDVSEEHAFVLRADV